jgi:hypothetical protein
MAGCAQKTSAPTRVKVLDDALYVVPGIPYGGQNNGISKADLMDVAEQVLAGMFFTIEKADVETGLIRTRPLPAAQFFEFWRSDNVGIKNTLAANLHTIRRVVTLDISQLDKELRIGCKVYAQRLSLPERQVSSSARVYGIFSRSSPSLQRFQLNPEQKKKMAWIGLGRDLKLEAEILKRIETQIVRRTKHRLQTTENET